MPADPTAWPAGLARTWLTRYNHFLFLTAALREFQQKGWAAGCLQDQITTAAWEAVDAADHLQAHGYRPHLWAGGDEARLWARTVEYVGSLPWRAPPPESTLAEIAGWAAGVRAAWDRYAAFVAGLPDDCFAAADALAPCAGTPESLARLVGRRFRLAAPADFGGQAGGEFRDPIVAVAGK
jgi:hypothetical protein